MYFKIDKTSFCSANMIHGWSQPEEDYVWSIGKYSVIHFPIICSELISVKIEFRSFLAEGRHCKFFVIINGHDCGLYTSEKYTDSLSLTNVSNKLESEHGIYIEFYHCDPVSPHDLGAGRDGRHLNIAIAGVSIHLIQSSIPLGEYTFLSINNYSKTQDALIKSAVSSMLHGRRDLIEESNAASIPKVLDGYLKGVGGNADDRGLLRDHIRRLLRDQGDTRDPFDHLQLRPHVINEYLPHQSQSMLRSLSSENETQTLLLEKVENRLFDPDFARTWDARFPTWFARSEVPGETIYSSTNADLIVDPRRYAIITRDGDCYFSGCNHADLGVFSIPGVVSHVSAPIVLLQDQFDCGNICHFLYDSMVRMMYWCRAFPEDVAKAIFVFGGRPTGFHRLVLNTIVEDMGIPESHIWFPSKTYRLRSAENVYWFTSECYSQHPCNGMRPESTAILQAICQKVTGRILRKNEDLSKFDKVYVSRIDGGGRKPANEDSIIEMLNSAGFKPLVMSNYSWETQINIIANAKVIVGIHGMGLTHLAFNLARPKVVEIFHPTRFSDAYALLSKAYGNQYIRLVGREVEPIKALFEVDLDELRTHLE